MSNRKLASIQRIKKLELIEGADFIEKAEILGWECVVKRGQFKEGDLCIFFEPDSLLPRKSWNEFLFNKNDNKKEFRLKTCKFKKQVSQGLALPLSILSNETIEDNLKSYQEGLDVTEILKISKYVPYIPAQLQGQVKGTRPEFVPKTDEVRIQSEPQILERYKGKTFYLSEKLDGTSCSFFFKNKEFGVCSRNMHLKETEGNIYWKVARELDIENKLKNYEKNLVVQGELWGNGVQGNKLKSEKLNFSVFNIYDVDSRTYLNIKDMLDVCDKLELEPIPVLDMDFKLNHTVKDLVELSKGNSFINKNVKREGIVFRPLKEERDQDIGRLSFKVIDADFLLKYGE